MCKKQKIIYFSFSNEKLEIPTDFIPSYNNCVQVGCPYHYLKEWDKDHKYNECMLGCLPNYNEVKRDCIFFFNIKKRLDKNNISIEKLREFKTFYEKGLDIDTIKGLSMEQISFLIENGEDLFVILPFEEE
jgi:hypothetical protein